MGGRGHERVGVERLLGCLLRLLPMLAAWALVVAGRGVCLLAQRLPPAVAVVRAVRRRQVALHAQTRRS